MCRKPPGGCVIIGKRASAGVVAFYWEGGKKRLGVVRAAAAGRVLLFLADPSFLGSTERGDPGFGLQLRGGNIGSEILAEGAGIDKEMDGGGIGFFRGDSGFDDWLEGQGWEHARFRLAEHLLPHPRIQRARLVLKLPQTLITPIAMIRMFTIHSHIGIL